MGGCCDCGNHVVPPSQTLWLLMSADGFLAVNEFLQCDGGPSNIFAAGDIASFTQSPRPKAGVFAVRAVRLDPSFVFCDWQQVDGLQMRPAVPVAWQSCLVQLPLPLPLALPPSSLHCKLTGVLLSGCRAPLLLRTCAGSCWGSRFSHSFRSAAISTCCLPVTSTLWL